MKAEGPFDYQIMLFSVFPFRPSWFLYFLSQILSPFRVFIFLIPHCLVLPVYLMSHPTLFFPSGFSIFFLFHSYLLFSARTRENSEYKGSVDYRILDSICVKGRRSLKFKMNKREKGRKKYKEPEVWIGKNKIEVTFSIFQFPMSYPLPP